MQQRAHNSTMRACRHVLIEGNCTDMTTLCFSLRLVTVHAKMPIRSALQVYQDSEHSVFSLSLRCFMDSLAVFCRSLACFQQEVLGSQCNCSELSLTGFRLCLMNGFAFLGYFALKTCCFCGGLLKGKYAASCIFCWDCVCGKSVSQCVIDWILTAPVTRVLSFLPGTA